MYICKGLIVDSTVICFGGLHHMEIQPLWYWVKIDDKYFKLCLFKKNLYCETSISVANKLFEIYYSLGLE